MTDVNIKHILYIEAKHKSSHLRAFYIFENFDVGKSFRSQLTSIENLQCGYSFCLSIYYSKVLGINKIPASFPFS